MSDPKPYTLEEWFQKVRVASIKEEPLSGIYLAVRMNTEEITRMDALFARNAGLEAENARLLGEIDYLRGQRSAWAEATRLSEQERDEARAQLAAVRAVAREVAHWAHMEGRIYGNGAPAEEYARVDMHVQSELRKALEAANVE